MFPSLYALLRELNLAQQEKNPLTSMIKISVTLKNHLDDALLEFENLDDAMYHLQKENEELIKRLTKSDVSI